MRRGAHLPVFGRASFVFIAAVIVAAFALSGCKSLDAPNTESAGAVQATGTVQADMTTATTDATAGAATTPTAPAASAAPKVWPAKVGTFAKKFGKGAWYPTYLPKGYKLDSLDVIELDKGTGLVCDIAYVNGESVVTFTQGSPKERDYEIVSVGKVAWGSAKADVVHQDPTDTTSPIVIVYSHGGTFIELQGDPSLDELKKVAASMVPVK